MPTEAEVYTRVRVIVESSELLNTFSPRTLILLLLHDDDVRVVPGFLLSLRLAVLDGQEVGVGSRPESLGSPAHGTLGKQGHQVPRWGDRC